MISKILEYGIIVFLIFTILAINPVNGEVAKSFKLSLPGGAEPGGLTWDGEYLWCTGSVEIPDHGWGRSGIYKINPSNGEVIKSLDLIAMGITWDGKYLWITDGTTIQKIDSSNGNVIKSFDSPRVRYLAWDGKYLWGAFGEREFEDIFADYRLNESERKYLKKKLEGELEGELEGNYTLYTIKNLSTCYYNNKIYKIDPFTGKVVKSLNSSGYLSAGLAWDGKYFWNADSFGEKIYKIDSFNGKAVKSFSPLVNCPPTGTAPRNCLSGLAWDGRYLWVANFYEKKIYKIDSFGANSAISLAEEAIVNASALGINVDEAEGYLEKAKNNFDEREFEQAKNYANEAEKRATASSKIKSAEEAIKNVRGIGVNSEAIRFLEKAKHALDAGQYELASDYAEKAKEAASPTMSYEAFLGLIAAIVIPSSIVYWKATARRRERKREYERKIEEWKAKVQKWKEEAYNVSELEDMLEWMK